MSSADGRAGRGQAINRADPQHGQIARKRSLSVVDSHPLNNLATSLPRLLVPRKPCCPGVCLPREKPRMPALRPSQGGGSPADRLNARPLAVRRVLLASVELRGLVQCVDGAPHKFISCITALSHALCSSSCAVASSALKKGAQAAVPAKAVNGRHRHLRPRQDTAGYAVCAAPTEAPNI